MPFDGKAFGEEIVGFVREYVDQAVGPLKTENENLKARLAEIEARPAPEVLKGDPGESVDPDAVNAMVTEAVSKAVAALPVPKDGKDAAGIVAPVKDNGELCFTLEDGRLLRTGIRDGEKGQDGKDGIDLSSFDAIVLDDDRTIELKFVAGEEERVASFKWPTAIYRDVFKEGTEYDRGDMVTWGGSLWHCNTPTKAKPGTDDWTLAAKKGRDGKDAKHG